MDATRWVLLSYAFGVSLWYLGALLMCRGPEERDRYTAVSVIWPIIALTAAGWWATIVIERTWKWIRKEQS